ncbi:transposase [Pseudobacteriovorax antillogorgiicola]|uniref:transposase n=1 Tax=Pseudobacteriovorax antillogorgiicola TaxID=1513793 RepID=UPI0010506423|nr:transposase [Pseudobacteriovorax antillogorgiicola]
MGSVRFGKVELLRNDGVAKSEPEKVILQLIDVREIDSPEKADPIHWMLLTTHEINSYSDALQVIEWYRKRWHIEQLFRSAMRSGLKLDEIQASSQEPIDKLAFLGLLASVETLQLTLCRDGKIDRDASELFLESELEVLQAQLSRLEGSTKNLQNPHRRNTIAWCHWVVARLGGWKGKSKHGSPAGPKDIKRGLNRLRQITVGWELATGKNVCIT